MLLTDGCWCRATHVLGVGSCCWATVAAELQIASAECPMLLRATDAVAKQPRLMIVMLLSNDAV
jgi:hypothetical protein